MCKISIIVPCFNSEDYVENLLNNLKLQTSKDFEVIFVDDCSLDNTYAILQKLIADCDFQCKVIRNKQNSGPGTSRNNGIAVAEGEYIMFVDSDDYMARETVSLIKNSILDNQYPDAILYDYYRTNGKNDIACETAPGISGGAITVSDALLYSKGSTWCKVYNREFIMEKSVRFPALNTNEDFTFNKTALSYCDSIFYLKKNLYYYVYNPNSIVNSHRGSNDNVRIAFDILSRDMNPVYKSILVFLKSTIYLYGSVQSMIRRKDNENEIKKFIDKFTAENREWRESTYEYRVSKYKRLMFFLIGRKNVSLLSLIIKLQDVVKKAFMQ